MWNHAQNRLPSGDDDTIEADPTSGSNQQLEKSLDLTPYLKYLDELFSQAHSESESSDSDEERSRTFTDFLQPAAQRSDRSQQPHFIQNNSSNISLTEANHVTTFNTLKSTDSFHLESNISSSSLSSIDSGTSSLSLNLSSESCPESQSPKKSEESTSVVTRAPSLCTDNSNSSAPTEDEKSGENSEKEKKSQKKKKSAKKSTESLPTQHKPSSGGKGNNGSNSGGGAGGHSTGTGGSSNTASTSGSGGSSSSSNQSSSPGGAKNRSAKQGSRESEILSASTLSTGDINSLMNFDSGDSQPDALLYPDSELVEVLASTSSGGTDSSGIEFETNHISLSALLGVHDDDSSLSDYISMEADASEHASPPEMSESTTDNFFSKIAADAVASAFSLSNAQHRNSIIGIGGNNDKGKSERSGKKRKIEVAIGKGGLAKLTEKQRLARIEMLNAKRKRIYVYISRKEVGKTQRNRATIFKESLAMKKKLAQACSRHLRKKAVQSQKCMKESVCKAKRLTQEMEIYWKHQDRCERDMIRKKEKEAEEKLKQDMEVLKKIADNRKLNRIITQLELFSAKLHNVIEKEEEILGKLDANDVKDDRVAHLDTYNKENDKSLARDAVNRAIQDHRNFVELLDTSGLYFPDSSPLEDIKSFSKPKMFEGILKEYQSKGMSWIRHLYKLGLNGIFADDFGLGKKTQVSAFLSHLAESGVWGPFLIVAPPSSLESWQHNLSRMSPQLKITPYWGKQTNRKTLRNCWEDNVHNEYGNFHVVITSYQVMVSDLKYFGKVKWQYLVMDDSQGAITSSTKWMSLLSFRCRNKLLVCSTPRLNSRTHLCAYLYFIMPSLFDVQEEFSEWLLKELDSTHAAKYESQENEVGRLKAVVEQFMLRRLRQDVEHENEIMVHKVDIQKDCCLTRRQIQLYFDLLERKDLREVMSDLEKCKPEEIRRRMNEMLTLSDDLRKACNHPDLLEKRGATSPLWMESNEMPLPKLIYEDLVCSTENQRTRNFHLFQIFSAANIYNSLFKEDSSENHVTKGFEDSTWSFIRLLELSFMELERLYTCGNASRLSHLVTFQSVLEKIVFEQVWRDKPCHIVTYPSNTLPFSFSQSPVLSKLVFTLSSASFPSSNVWENCSFFSLPDTIQQRTLRSRKAFRDVHSQPTSLEIINIQSGKCNLQLQSMKLPDLECCCPKVTSGGFRPVTQSKRINEFVRLLESRCLPSEFRNVSGENEVILQRPLSPYQKPQILIPEGDQFVADSGKLQSLDKLLSSFKVKESRVLICSYFRDTLDLIEDLLKLRKWKYRFLDCEKESQDTFVYLLHSRVYTTSIQMAAVDTVVWFDHDWDTKAEELITKSVNKLAHPNQVNYYRLICRGRIEERIMKLARERNIISLALSKDVLDNPHVSLIPSLKGLVSVLMCEYEENEDWLESQMEFKDKLQDLGKRVKNEDECLNTETEATKMFRSYAKDTKLEGSVYGGIVNMLDFVTENGGSDSASPSCSEELDPAEMESDLYMKECQDDDNFNFSFDEGYMGMSPESYEDHAVKSDYEEDSSPKKPKLGRGSGKRGRPPSIRFHMRQLGGDASRRGPGRPRLKPIGPANQGLRGRRPGRPPLSKKAETIASGLTPLSSGQKLFGFYSSPDLELS